MSTTTTPRRLGRRLAALALAACGLAAATTGGTAGAVVAPPDALAFIPTAGLVTYVYRDGTTTSITGTGTYAKSLPGQFDATPGGDLFLYNPGGGADGVLHIDWSGSSTSLSFTPMTVSGTFTPVVGDFDGNGVDDILWYAPGSAADYLWRFDAAGGHTSVRVSVGGTYKPIVIDANGDGRQDIVWYAPGAGADSIWLFKADASHTSKAVSIGGSYTPVVGEFGAVAAGAPPEGIVFFNPAGADYLWTFTSSAGHTSDPLPNVDGNYQLLPGQFIEETYGSLFYYGAGSLPEHLFAFGPGAGPDISEQEVPSISGAYTMTTADFDGNQLSDLSLSSGTSTTRLWKFQFDGSIVSQAVTSIPPSSYPVAVDMGIG